MFFKKLYKKLEDLYRRIKYNRLQKKKASLSKSLFEESYVPKQNDVPLLKKPTPTSFYVGSSIFEIDPYGQGSMILSGRARTGKTFTFFKPNIVKEKNASMFILDACGEYLDFSKSFLKDNGYKIITINKDNIDDNEFNQRKLPIENDEDISIILNKLFEIEDEEELFDNIEVYLFRCISKIVFKKLGFLTKKEIYRYFVETNLDTLKKDLDLSDKYLKDNFNEFLFFHKELDKLDYEELKNKLLIKHEFLKEDSKQSFLFNDNDFSILRKEKVAVFFQSDTFEKGYGPSRYSPAKSITSFYINEMLSQLTEYDKGLRVKFFIDNAESVGKIENLERFLAISRGRNYSLFLGFQDLGNIESIYGDAFRIILACIGQTLMFGELRPSDIDRLNLYYGLAINPINCYGPRFSNMLIYRSKKDNCFKEYMFEPEIPDFLYK